MKFLISITGILFAALFAHAQSTREFGDVATEELALTSYDRDPSAAAVMLFDKGEFMLFGDLTATVRRHVRIKFFSQEKIKEWVDPNILIVRGEETITKIKAATYNLKDGKTVVAEMPDSMIFRTRYNNYYDQVQFVLPNVVAGSVIEYSFVYKTSASGLPIWRFQYDIPVLWSEIDARIPSSFIFSKEIQGSTKPTIQESKTGRERWVMQHVPAFRPEPYILSEEDYVSKLGFHITEFHEPGYPVVKLNVTWGSVATTWFIFSGFEEALKHSSFLKKSVDEITAGIDDPRKKIQVIYEYVKKNVTWDKFLDKIPDHSLKSVLDKKKGSNSEINTLLVCMLRHAGINAHPVLIRTRDNGRIHADWPRFSQFDDIICLARVGNKNFFLDGTDPFLPWTALPERCMTDYGLVMQRDSVRFIPIGTQRSRTSSSTEVTLATNGTMQGHLTVTRSGHDAAKMRRKFNDQGERDYVSTAYTSFQTENSKFSNIDNPNETAREDHDITVDGQLQVSGERMYLNPFVVDKIEDNPFKSTERNYPVDFNYPFDHYTIAKFTLPEGLGIEEQPADKIISLPGNGGRYSFTAKLEGNVLSISSLMTINRTAFGMEEYGALKEFYDQVIAKQAEQFVLRKK